MLKISTRQERSPFARSGMGPSRADVGLPDGIRQLIGRRLERLGLTTRRLLTIGAVMGREFRLSDIEALVDVGEDAVLDAMDEARRPAS